MISSKFLMRLSPLILANLTLFLNRSVYAAAIPKVTLSRAVHQDFALDKIASGQDTLGKNLPLAQAVGSSLDSSFIKASPPIVLGSIPATVPSVVQPSKQFTQANSSFAISQANPTLPVPRRNTVPNRLDEPPPETPLPEQPLPPLPLPEDLLPQPQPSAPPIEVPGDVPSQVFVKQFQVQGSTVFSPEELAVVTAPYEGRNLSFAELLQVRSAITQLYVSRGYVTSGAYLPPQTLRNGVVTIQVVEGGLEGINVVGTRRLRQSYIRSRLALAASTPLNTNRLLEGLRLLQIDPLIRNISADLQAGTRPGISLLQVQVAEADTFSADLLLNNGRSPSVGSFRRGVQLTEANLFGLGDGLAISYNNTDGSNQVDSGYTLPINPRNSTLRFAFGFSNSNVIEPPFNQLDIISNSRYYEISLRQPLYQTSTEEFALGLTASRQESKAEFSPFDTETQPFPSLGADQNGRTRISALRFFQEWTKRSSSYVLAARSQFSLGLDLFNATVNDSAPDSRFFAWRGQGQWVRLLAPDTLLLTRLDAQVSDSALVPLEQLSLGGQDTVRGYRQDFLLTDNGGLFSTEVRVPILRVPSIQGVLQVVPFLDIGTGWNNDATDPSPSTLIGTGIGLLWRQGDYLTIRLDYGIPLVSVDRTERTWQESGVYFSIVATPF